MVERRLGLIDHLNDNVLSPKGVTECADIGGLKARAVILVLNEHRFSSVIPPTILFERFYERQWLMALALVHQPVRKRTFDRVSQEHNDLHLAQGFSAREIS